MRLYTHRIHEACLHRTPLPEPQRLACPSYYYIPLNGIGDSESWPVRIATSRTHANPNAAVEIIEHCGWMIVLTMPPPRVGLPNLSITVLRRGDHRKLPLQHVRNGQQYPDKVDYSPIEGDHQVRVCCAFKTERTCSRTPCLEAMGRQQHPRCGGLLCHRRRFCSADETGASNRWAPRCTANTRPTTC